MPAIARREHPRGFGRTPRSGIVRMQRRSRTEHWIHHPPGRFDPIFASEERLVAPDGISDQALVRRPLRSPLVRCEQLDRLAHHLLTRLLGPRLERYRHLGGEPETETVGIARLLAK